MSVGDGGAVESLAVLEVVEDAEEGLDEEEADEDCAEDGVGSAGGFVELFVPFVSFVSLLTQLESERRGMKG